MIEASPAAPKARSLSFVFMVFTGFLAIGIPLPAIVSFVRQELGLGSTLAGLAFGSQSLATILSRHAAGSMVDRHGARPIALAAMPVLLLSTGLYLGSTLTGSAYTLVSLGLLLCGRVFAGIGESFLLISAMVWAINLSGISNSGQVMARQGLAMFLAIGWAGC